MKIREVISKGFSLWRKNPIIMLPFLFWVAAYTLLGWSFNYWVIEAQPFLEQMNSVTLRGIANILFSPRWPFLLLSLILTAAVLFFGASAIALSAEICKKKRVHFKDVFRLGRKFYSRYLIINSIITSVLVAIVIVMALLGIGIIGPASLASLTPSNMDKGTALKITFIALCFAVVLGVLYLFFYLSNYLMILNDLKPIKSIKQSFSFVAKNFFLFLFLIIIFALLDGAVNVVLSFILAIARFIGSEVLLSIIAGMIKITSFVISTLIITPIQTISIILFILGRK